MDDVLYMANDTIRLYEQEKKKPAPIVSPLSHNRLLLNNRVTPRHSVRTLQQREQGGRRVFVSTRVKEKENTEKKKEPEVVAVYGSEQ